MSLPKTSSSDSLKIFIRQVRTKYGLSQDEMAERITEAGYPVSGETISRWEITGKIPPLRNPEYAIILARAYGTTPPWLLKLGGYLDFLPVGDLDAIVGKIPARLLNLLDKASVKQLELITRVVAAILAEEE